MDLNMNAAVTFGELLQKNPQASAFYDRCTPEQRNAILLQLGQITSRSQLRAFVDNLPSASL
ncbi:MAG: YdeI/OmpD-associated family protein [Lawsonibacter sp.]|nr:YdeI/OmpD-associated family protein [Lawsonibacter sp.]